MSNIASKHKLELAPWDSDDIYICAVCGNGFANQDEDESTPCEQKPDKQA